MIEKRRFKRIPMDAPARIDCGDRQWQTTLIDISLKGALITVPDGWTSSSERCHLEVLLEPGVAIAMGGTVAHCNEQRLGFRCDHIGLESITHLKRLVQLNLGDEALLERELSELMHCHDDPAADRAE